MVIVLSTTILGVALNRSFRQFDENRVRVGGLLGGILRPTIAKRLETATLIGAIHLYGSVLFALPNAQYQSNLARLELMLAHEAISWELALRLGELNIAGVPSLTTIRQARVVGQLFLVSQTLLLAMIYPVLGRSNWRAS